MKLITNKDTHKGIITPKEMLDGQLGIVLTGLYAGHYVLALGKFSMANLTETKIYWEYRENLDTNIKLLPVGTQIILEQN